MKKNHCWLLLVVGPFAATADPAVATAEPGAALARPGAATSRPAAAAPTRPKLLHPKQLRAMFGDEQSVDRYLKERPTPERVIHVASYYVMNVLDQLEQREKSHERILERTIGLLEDALRTDPSSQLLRALLGDAYGLKVGYSGFPALLAWAGKCQTELDQAVRLSHGDPEVRMLRLRAMVHFPYQVYPGLRRQNVADANVVLGWIAEVAAAGRIDPDMKRIHETTLVDLRNEVYFVLGRYFLEQVEDRPQALWYLRKVDAKCWKHCARARKLMLGLK
jgi:hypothetical protein